MDEPRDQSAAAGLQLLARGTEHYLAGEAEPARRCLERGLFIQRRVDDRTSIADSLAILGGLYHDAPFHDLARGYYRAAIGRYRELGDGANQAVVTGNLALVEHVAGELATAARGLRAAIDLCDDSGQSDLAALLTGQLANLLLEQRKWTAAIEHYDRAIDELRQAGDARGLGLCLAGRGAARAAGSDLDRAAADLEAAADAAQVIDDPAAEAAIWLFGGLLDVARTGGRDADRPGAANELTARARSRIDSVAESLKQSDEVRFPLRLLRRALGRAAPPDPDRGRILPGADGTTAAPLGVALDGRRFHTPGGEPIDLGRRAALRRILLRLIRERIDQPERAVGRSALLEAGWPERHGARADAPRRVDDALRTLRGLGLDRAILGDGDGYRIAVATPLAIGTPDTD